MWNRGKAFVEKEIYFYKTHIIRKEKKSEIKKSKLSYQDTKRIVGKQNQSKQKEGNNKQK